MLMISQSIADDITMQSCDLTIVTLALEKWYIDFINSDIHGLLCKKTEYMLDFHRGE